MLSAHSPKRRHFVAVVLGVLGNIWSEVGHFSQGILTSHFDWNCSISYRSLMGDLFICFPDVFLFGEQKEHQSSKKEYLPHTLPSGSPLGLKSRGHQKCG